MPKKKEKKTKPVPARVAEIVGRMAKARVVEDLVCNVAHRRCIDGDLEDLVQIVYIALLEMDADKLEDLVKTGAINFFIVRIIMNQYNSGHSPFFDEIRRFRYRSSEISQQIADSVVEKSRY